jgi:hypothetical protein
MHLQLRPVLSGLRIDELDEDECRLEEVEYQGRHVEGHITVPAHPEDDEKQWNLDREFQEPEEDSPERALAKLCLGHLPIGRPLESEKYHQPVHNEVDHGRSDPEAVARDVIEVEANGYERGDDHEQSARHHCLDLGQLARFDVSAAGNADQSSKSHKDTRDLSDRHEEDNALHQPNRPTEGIKPKTASKGRS